MKKNPVLETIALIVLIIGGLNWGLIGFFEWNFIGTVFGYVSTLSRAIYAIIGIAAIYKILTFSNKKGK